MTSADLTPLQKLAKGLAGDTSFQPLALWLLPVLLRTRDRYYGDAMRAIRSQLDSTWELQRSNFGSREEFEQSLSAQRLWRAAQPPWWGLNDIVGYIDIALDLSESAIRCALFATKQRPSRTLVYKMFVPVATELVSLRQHSTNEPLRTAVLASAANLARNPRVKGRCIDLLPLQAHLRRTNLVGLIRDEIARIRAGSPAPAQRRKHRAESA